MSRLFEVDREFKAGIQRTLTFFRTLERNTQANLPQAAVAAATAILNRSRTYVPVDEGLGQPDTYVPPHPGLLKESGRVELSQEGHFVSAFVIYGSAQAFYAVYAHERWANHKAPTQWKYLERAVQETQTRLSQIFKKYLGGQPGTDLQIEPLEELSSDSGSSGELYYGHAGGMGPVHQAFAGPGE